MSKFSKLARFQQKHNEKALWMDGLCNSPWVSEKFQRIELPPMEGKNDRGAIVELIKSCGNKKDILTLGKIGLEKSWINGDISIANTLIRSYAKCGAVKEAQDVFDQLVDRDVVSWNALIAGYIEQGLSEEALTCFSAMESDGIIPNRATYVSFLKASAIVGAIGNVEKIHGQVRDKGLLEKDIVLGTALVNAYAKCGAVSEAQKAFEQLVEPDIVSWSALIDGYAEQGFGEEALSCFRKMESDGMIPNPVTYTCILKSCATLGVLNIVKQVHVQVMEQHVLSKHVIIGNSLINAYCKCGAVKEARIVFDQLVERNVESWNALITGYVHQGFNEDALTCFSVMKNDGVTPNSVTYTCSLKACAIVGAFEVVEKIHTHLREQGSLNKHIVLGNSLISAYSKCGALKEAQEVFDQLAERNVVSWTALIDGYAEQGYAEEALRCFREMENDRVAPNEATYACALKGCAILGDLKIVKEIHAQVREQGLLNKHIALGNSLINAYAKCGAVKDAQKVFDQLNQRSVVSWSALIDGYAEQGFGEEALRWFREMENNGVIPNAVTYACTLKACAIVGDLKIVEEIHAHVREKGLLNKHVIVGTTLVNAYARCGAMEQARKVFEKLVERNVETWTALLAGYAQLGLVSLMLQLFTRMIAEGILPSPVTFLVLLSKCSHGALLEEGERLFYMMGAYGVAPSIEHYSCMVDLLGRAGRLENARHFVVDHIPSLMALLGACCKWVNVDLGRWTFERLLQLDHKCDSAYVCIANIYAAAGMPKEANEIELERLKQKT